jgi:hypothetical protein
MSSNHARPKWWQLYLIFPLLIALFTVDTRLKFSTRGHQVFQIGAVLLVYGLVHVWIKANARALSAMDQEQFDGRVIVTRLRPHQLTSTDNKQRPMFQLPDLEIKGTLSQTFEMDYIDVKSFSIDEVPQELNKE